MTEPLCPGGAPVDRIEITNGIQDGPAVLTGRFGTTLDYSNAERMTFTVDAVDADGYRLTLYDDRSYEQAIVHAEEAGKDWGVPVDDLVAP